jgi:hypothetical protein
VLQRLRLNCASSAANWSATTRPAPNTKATATTRITMRFIVSPSFIRLMESAGSLKNCRNAIGYCVRR